MVGSGTCTLKIKHSKYFALAEPIPDKLPITGSSLEHHLFVKVAEPTAAQIQAPTKSNFFQVEVSAVGSELEETTGNFVPVILYPNTFLHHTFILDRAAFQLRCKSRELTGNLPPLILLQQSGKATAEDIGQLRALLDLVRRDVHETRRAAQVSSSQIGTHL